MVNILALSAHLVAIKQLTGSSLPEEARECDAKSGLDCDWLAVPQTPTINCHPFYEIVVWLRETNDVAHLPKSCNENFT